MLEWILGSIGIVTDDLEKSFSGLEPLEPVHEKLRPLVGRVICKACGARAALTEKGICRNVCQDDPWVYGRLQYQGRSHGHQMADSTRHATGHGD